MNKENPKLTRRELLAVVTFSSASLIGLSGTFAQLSDDEESANNAVQAATLDLKINSGDSTVVILDVSGITPGESGSDGISLKNSGNGVGSLDVTVDVTGDTEGTNGGADGSGGELDSNVELSGSYASGTVWSYATASSLSNNTYTLDSSFDSGVTETFTLNWRLPNHATLDSKKDGVTVRLEFSLKE